MLAGEPGIGKSALLAYARHQAKDMLVLSASGAEAESALPYATLQQLLRPVLGRAGRLPGPQAVALRVALGLKAGPAPDRFLVSLAALSLLAEAAAGLPVLCLVDDAQWADRPSLQAMAFVARRLENDPVALLAAARSGECGELEAAGTEVLIVPGLAPGAAAELLRRQHGQRLAPVVRDVLVAACGGNPLALTELPALLTPGQLAGRDSLPDPVPLPGQLERVFEARIGGLDPELRTLALLCAAGGSAPVQVIAWAGAALGVSAPASRLAGAGQLLRIGGGAVTFGHPLMRSAAYHAAAPASQQAAHLALAEALAADETQADRRAWHLARAATGPDEQAADELERSAGRALARSGHAAAAVMLERAAELSGNEPARARRLAAAADAAWHGGDADRAAALVGEAERLPADQPARLKISYLRGEIEVRSGTPADGLAMLLPAAADAVRADPGLALRMLNVAAEAAFLVGDPDAHRKVRALMASLPEIRDPGEALLVRLSLAISPVATGRKPGCLDADLTALTELDDPQLLERAGGMAFGLGRFALSRRLRRAAVARARARGAAGVLAWALRGLAFDELVRGRYPWAAACAEEGRRLAAETGQPNLACWHQAILADVAAIQGREEETRELTESVLAAAAERGLHSTAALARRALGGLALASGHPDEALTQFSALLTPGLSAHRGIALLVVPDLTEAAVRTGRPQEARERAEEFLAWAGKASTAEMAALAARTRALLGDGMAADELFRQALAAHSATDRPLDQARTALLYGEHLRRSRRRADARQPLRAALDAFEHLGARCWAERARAELRATGQTARRPGPGTVGQLTPQELQVARAVSGGATSRQAAAQLFISPRTVDHHLRNVFRKLGIASRGELIRLGLAGEGLPGEPADS